MAVAIVQNAIGFAQFKLLGGWKNTLVAVGGYTVIFAALMFGFASGLSQPAAITFSVFAYIFLSVQVAVLLLYGTVRVSLGIRADVRTRMIESHRLMPVEAGSAVAGYLFGAPLQALALFLVNYLLGTIAVSESGQSFLWWNFANGVLLTFSAFVWSIVLFFSFRSSLALWTGVGALLVIPFSSFRIFLILPGTLVLTSPLIGHTVFDPRSGDSIDWTYGVSIGAQVLIAVLYLIAARTRYQRDGIAFGPLLSLLLLAAWACVCAIGTTGWLSFAPNRLFFREHSGEATGISVAMTLLLAMLPVCSSVRLGASAPSGSFGRRFSPWLMIAASTLVVLAIFKIILDAHNSWVRVAQTGVVAIAFLAGVRYLLGLVLRPKLRPRLILFAWLLITWGLPMLVYSILEASTSSSSAYVSRDPFNWVGMLSPMQELYSIWTDSRSLGSIEFTDPLGPCVLSLALAIAYHTFGSNRVHRRQPPAIPPSLNAVQPSSAGLPTLPAPQNSPS
jgi:hypothetical protein